MTPALPVAHLGHWYASLLYVAPVVVLGLWSALHSWRERRRRRRESPPG